VILSCPQVLFQEILLGGLLRLHLTNDVFRELVCDPSAANLWNLVLWMRTTNLVGPLHLFGLDDHSANLGFAVLCWSEGHDEVCTFFAIGLEKATLGLDDELRG